MKKIVITQDLQFTEKQKERLKALWEVTEYNTTPTHEEWLERVQWQDIILSEEVWLPENQYNIKNVFLTFPFSWFLWDVDIKRLQENNVVTTSAKWWNKFAVAEWIITALLHLTRQVEAIQSWNLTINPADLTSLPSWVYNLKVLILWKWSIGTEVGKICDALWAQVDYFTRWDNLLDKVKGRDVIINCMSEKDDTKWLLTKEIFLQISNPFYYITAMRDTIHDTSAIRELLSNGKMLWYADDCFSRDAEYYKNQLSLAGNTFITHHIARASKSGVYYSNEVMIENVKKYLAWTPQNLLY